MPSDDSLVPDFPHLLRLEGRRFLVAGAGFGMGRQAAHALASVGASVCCLDIIEDRAVAVAKEIGGIALVADVRRASELEQVVSDAESQLGGLDGIVDIVGTGHWSSIVAMPEEEWDGALDDNLRHAFLMVKFGAPALKRAGGGCITFVTSISGSAGSPYHSGYGAAKAGLISLVKSAAAELRGDAIRVNAVAPGPTATPRMVETTGEASDGTLHGWAATYDVAAALLFLSSDMARHISGHNLVVDGGATAEYPMQLPESLTAGSKPA